ncbi:MAG: prepilin-type N-terminal cleavage/methylation domain-containing protein [Aridibacter famidurans]|nr:prepilin-type N-terminal cleavage/methylation domain-containing protein [Aridibacter famidurans]
MKNKRRDESGFSLIELLLIVVIVGLLATIAIPSLLKSRDAAEKAAAIGTLHTLHINQTGYYTHNGRYANLVELNNYAGKKLGTMTGSTLIRGNYTYYIFPSSAGMIQNQFQILAVRFKDRRVISAFMLEQDGSIETLVD